MGNNLTIYVNNSTVQIKMPNSRKKCIISLLKKLNILGTLPCLNILINDVSIIELNLIEEWPYGDKVDITLKAFTSALEEGEIHKLWLKYLDPVIDKELYKSVSIASSQTLSSWLFR